MVASCPSQSGVVRQLRGYLPLAMVSASAQAVVKVTLTAWSFADRRHA